MLNFKRMEILIVFPQLLQLVITVLCRGVVENTLCPKRLVGIFLPCVYSSMYSPVVLDFFEPCKLLPKKKGKKNKRRKKILFCVCGLHPMTCMNFSFGSLL